MSIPVFGLEGLQAAKKFKQSNILFCKQIGQTRTILIMALLITSNTGGIIYN